MNLLSWHRSTCWLHHVLQPVQAVCTHPRQFPVCVDTPGRASGCCLKHLIHVGGRSVLNYSAEHWFSNKDLFFFSCYCSLVIKYQFSTSLSCAVLKYFFTLFLGVRVSLCRLGRPGTQYVDQDGLEFTNI